MVKKKATKKRAGSTRKKKVRATPRKGAVSKRRKKSESKTDPAPASPRTIDYDALRIVAGGATLQEIVPTQFGSKASQPLHALCQADLDEVITYGATRLESPEGHIASSVRFNYEATLNGEDVAAVSGTMLVIYRFSLDAPGQIGPEELDQFAEVNGIYNSWAYLRELISHCLMRLGLPGVFVPLWKPPASLPPLGEMSVMRSPTKRSRPDDSDE